VSGYSADILNTISPYTSLAKNNGKPFQIDEVGVNSDMTSRATDAGNEANWLDGLRRLGSSAQLISYFSEPGSKRDLSNNAAVAVPAWRDVARAMADK
jgi:hypothetical protein